MKMVGKPRSHSFRLKWENVIPPKRKKAYYSRSPYRFKSDIEERTHDRKCIKCNRYCWPNYFICKSCLAISPEWWEENYYLNEISPYNRYDTVSPFEFEECACEDTAPLVEAYEDDID